MIRCLVFCCVALSTASCFGEPPAPRRLYFETDVRPLLKEHCFHCHGEADELSGGLDTRLTRLLQAGGESGPAVVTGAPAESLLYQRLRDGEMPPDESKLLSHEDVETIRSWIEQGAPTRRPEPQKLGQGPLITAEERGFWSFQPIRRPTPPTPFLRARVANPIDAFVLHRLESEGLTYSPPAAPSALTRRAYFDLLGLPPTPAELARWEADRRPGAWSRLIDRLLASPHYGQRWGRHWLDAAGYADSEGYTDVDPVRPNAWRYRDYVIRSWNADKPFDRFLIEQIAGDELTSSPLTNLAPRDVELLTATGFLRMAPDGTGGGAGDPDQARNDVIAETVKIVSSSVLGLTLGCAQCHDHRYDPLPQVDYYRFRAAFEPALNWRQWRVPAQRRVSLYTDADRAAAAKIEAQAKAVDARRTARQNELIEATFQAQVAKLPAELREAAQTARRTPAKKRTSSQVELLKKHPNLNVTAGSLYLYNRKAADELKKLAAEAAKIRARKPREQFVRALTEPAGPAPATFVFHRGDFQSPKQAVEPAGLSVIDLNTSLPAVPPDDPTTPSTGRRLALARRLTHPAHPLTARVLANRIWLHHFGRGLVATPGDFGALGDRPTHPELLDWLAAELIDSGWSVKHLHRLILQSHAWRQSARRDPGQQHVDPDNKLVGGARQRRLESEALRDAMLMTAGCLNDQAGGEPVPVMADRVGRIVIGKENLNAGRPGAVIPMGGQEHRRSVYVQFRRSRPLSVMATFDAPPMTPNCVRRQASTSASQSLLLMNSDLVVALARRFAQRLQREAGPDVSARLELAWRLAYARPPAAEEEEAAQQFLHQQTALYRRDKRHDAEGDAWAVMCHMLLSSNEFLYID